jgi:porphyrinogen peroxidase
MPSPADSTPEAQQVLAPLSLAAIYLVVEMEADSAADAAMRAMCEDVGALIRSVGFRDLEANLSCVMGIGSQAWDRIVAPAAPASRPAGLHPFVELRGANHHAPSTPGDLLFHIRAARFDVCFELATQILAKLGPRVASADEVDGFRYFDARDLLGFVDGTENPVGSAVAKAVIIGDEDPDFAGGSYVIVQKYLHDIDAWNALSTEAQELVIGRTKLADIELADDVKPSNAHNALTVVEVDGEEIPILRDNMPFGSPASGEFGTYFIGYAKSPWVTEEMLRNMFLGRPEGNYDRILDFSTAVTGSLFFVPALDLLESLADIGTGPAPAALAPPVAAPPVAAPPAAAPPAAGSPTSADGSLGIGGLR